VKLEPPPQKPRTETPEPKAPPQKTTQEGEKKKKRKKEKKRKLTGQPHRKIQTRHHDAQKQIPPQQTRDERTRAARVDETVPQDGIPHGVLGEVEEGARETGEGRD
jgi:hypothetical protein